MLFVSLLSTLFLCVNSASDVSQINVNETLETFGSRCCSCDVAVVQEEVDYYWRDYYGVVPPDAVQGGYTESGSPTYIGQLPAAKHSGVFPGNLYPGTAQAFYCPGETVINGNYVKILCSNPSNIFLWIRTTASESHLITNYQWVRGGGQGSHQTYIGRAWLDGQVQVGRVFPSDSNWKGIWLCNRAGEQINILSFELLVRKW